MKIAYFGYDFFSDCAEVLLAENHDIIAIFSVDCDNQRYVFNNRLEKIASGVGLQLTIKRPTREDLENLANSGCELLVSAAYPYRIPIEYAGNCRGINIHPTLLPRGRGPWPLPHVILKNDEQSGVTIHNLSPKFDSGDILAQNSYPVNRNETLESLSCKAQMTAKELFRNFIRDYVKGAVSAQRQSDLGEGEYWPTPSFEDRTFDWSHSVDQIDRIARAFGRFNSFATFANKEWIIDSVDVWKQNHNQPIGSVVHRTSREVVVAASDGYVCIKVFEIDPDWQLANKGENL